MSNTKLRAELDAAAATGAVKSYRVQVNARTRNRRVILVLSNGEEVTYTRVIMALAFCLGVRAASHALDKKGES